MLRRAFTFCGRNPRKVYWISGLLVILVLVVAMLAVLAAFGGLGAEVMEAAAERKAMRVCYALFILAMWPVSALTITRLHDLGRTGWWAIAILAPGVLVTTHDFLFDDGEGRQIGIKTVLEWCDWAILVVSTLYLGFVRGTEGPNAYGPDPLAQAVPPTAAGTAA